MGINVQGEHPRDVLSDKGRGTAHEAGKLHHQYGFDQFRYPKSNTACLRNDQGRHSQFHRRAGAAVGRQGHSGKCGGARTDLDAADPFDNAGGSG